MQRLLAIVLLLCGSAFAADRFIVIPGSDVKAIDGNSVLLDQASGGAECRMVLADGAEGYVLTPWLLRSDDGDARSATRLVIRTPSDNAPTGTIYVSTPFLPRAKGESGSAMKFRIDAAPSADAKDLFYIARMDHYRRLQFGGGAGAAWFRYQADQSRQQVSAEKLKQVNDRWGWMGQTDDRPELDLFTGGRALSENLQLERQMRQAATAGNDVDVSTIKGISVAEMDFTKLVGDAKPKLDTLSVGIPADQYAVFFPSATALFTTIDQATARVLPMVDSLAPGGEDAGVSARYQKQLGLPGSELARLLGPKAVTSIAITGSDPFFPLGTDVAIIFESPNPTALQMALAAQITVSANQMKVKPEMQDVAGAKCLVARSSDREICTYLAAIGKNVVVSNSPEQIRRLAAASSNAGDVPATLASLPEYRFFRSRYVLGDAGETFLVIVPDAAIRKWCSARWRIADARRIEARARMLDDAARGIADGKATGPAADPTYGSAAFMTPISEISLDKVTASEANAYTRWRDGYQRNWRGAFDPIAIRMGLSPQAIAGDLTVMPLIASSEYAQFLEATGNSALNAGSGDPHDALLHFVMALDPDSPPVKQLGNMGRTMIPGAQIDLLSWLGKSVALYLDDDPVWKDIEQAGNQHNIGEKYANRLPIALRAESRNPLKLAAFLTALHAMADQSAPRLTVWENLEASGLPYVKVSAAKGGGMEEAEKFSIYYAALPDSLVVSLSEDVIKHALARSAAKNAGTAPAAAATAPAPTTRPWLGTSVALQARPAAINLFRFMDWNRSSQVQRASWANLPILNEWKRLFPDQDLVTAYERAWGVRLTCPAGGQYVWNEKYQTMESTIAGCPEEPKAVPDNPQLFQRFSFGNFGLSFENRGLRARVQLDIK